MENHRCQSQESSSNCTVDSLKEEGGEGSGSAAGSLGRAATTGSGGGGRAATPSSSGGESRHCKFCDVDFESAVQLEIHLHADHVLMRDGKDLRCPRANCDRVYPGRDSLRQHIAAHFVTTALNHNIAGTCSTQRAFTHSSAKYSCS